MTDQLWGAGYVYILVNESMPGLVKIGHSLFSSKHRAKQLFTTGVPTPFVVAHEQHVHSPGKVERQVHARLKRYRNNSKREFFALPLEEAIRVVAEVAAKYSVANALSVPCPACKNTFVYTPSGVGTCSWTCQCCGKTFEIITERGPRPSAAGLIALSILLLPFCGLGLLVLLRGLPALEKKRRTLVRTAFRGLPPPLVVEAPPQSVSLSCPYCKMRFGVPARIATCFSTCGTCRRTFEINGDYATPFIIPILEAVPRVLPQLNSRKSGDRPMTSVVKEGEPIAPSSACPNQELLKAYLRHKALGYGMAGRFLNLDDSLAVTEHLTKCGRCLTYLRALQENRGVTD